MLVKSCFGVSLEEEQITECELFSTRMSVRLEDKPIGPGTFSLNLGTLTDVGC